MQLRKKVEFKTNLPVQVALAYDNGILKQDGRFGDYWIYTLADERVMFVPPIVHDQIEKLKIARGQAFSITKQEKRVGNKRVIEWLVENTEGPEAADKPAHAECSPRTQPEPPVPALLVETQPAAAEVAEPQVKQEDGKQEKETPAAAGDAPEPASAVQGGAGVDGMPAEKATPKLNGESKTNGQAKSNGQAKTNSSALPAADATAGEKSNTSPLFRASMHAAIDALIDAEAYAAKKNYSVRFTNEDLRATAISIFIAVREGYSR
jgi:hypothetical protein